MAYLSQRNRAHRKSGGLLSSILPTSFYSQERRPSETAMMVEPTVYIPPSGNDMDLSNDIPSISNPLAGITTLGSMVNPNVTVQTQVTEQRMVNPLDLSDVKDEKDRARLERIDSLFCSLSNDMPLLTKHKPRITNTTYILKYDWDDSIFEFDLFKMIGRFQSSLIQEVKLGKQGLKFIVFKHSELKKQEDMADDTRGVKRKRVDEDS